MPSTSGGYVTATRHPWPCFLFVLPLLLVYEVGVFAVGGAQPEAVRNGADHWLRCGLGAVGLSWVWLPPLVLGVVLAAWAGRCWSDRPGDLVGVMSGMVLESVSFALGLWALGRFLAPMLQRLGADGGPSLHALPPETGHDPALRLVVTYLGAGIYEEALFRLVLFAGLVKVLRWLDLPMAVAVVLAGTSSAVLFSVAHHIGPYGQDYSNYLFLFRVMAGLYFALLFQARGFGIAVGAHACYNVMVSVS